MGSKSGGCNSSTRVDNINNININNNDIKIDKKLDDWRKYFRKSNAEIFDIIEHAIMVAAIDSPSKFRVKKTGIAELLFSCRLTQCPSCHHHDHDHHGHDHDGMVKNNQFDDCGSKDVEIDDNHDDHDHDDDNHDHDDGDDDDDDDDVDIGGDEGGEMELIDSNVDPSSNVSYGDVEALNDLIEQEKELINEVLRIKDILYNSQDESESMLFESLRRLQLMHLTFNILQETEIGKAVSHIKRHNSKDIRHLARSLIAEWKSIVDQWVKSTQELAEGGTPDSINPSTVDEEEGLPSPPMDEGVFFSTQTMDFNQFFDGMDDDGSESKLPVLNASLVFYVLVFGSFS
ncbi:hypothetical protein RND81_14G042600 [Saponaria officinalis]|uniref:TFIIS N-terminal domain-containing protein n=1 Tax=Saponaria officinalis TaxID=3572 RepID=A0AAW1GSC5_SAPOF